MHKHCITVFTPDTDTTLQPTTSQLFKGGRPCPLTQQDKRCGRYVQRHKSDTEGQVLCESTCLARIHRDGKGKGAGWGEAGISVQLDTSLFCKMERAHEMD